MPGRWRGSAHSAGLALCAAIATVASSARGSAVPVRLARGPAGWQLQRGGRPYFVKGACGDGSLEKLAAAGGNSVRTWSAGEDTARTLDAAHRLGLTVTVGIWLGHKEQGFDYRDAAAVRRQLDEARRTVLRFKDHPALLIWALGNEMETHGNDGPDLWRAVEDLARMVHEVDPAHPTMTVVAEIDAGKVEAIRRACPDLDVLGINSYGGGASLGARYPRDAPPFLITEFGPAGIWEIGRDAIGAAEEPTSTAKALSYAETYRRSVLGASGLCLGSYAFAWGSKVEATATWFGMFLRDGTRLAAVDALSELWTGSKPSHPVPALNKLALLDPPEAAAGALVRAVAEVANPGGGRLTYAWALVPDLGESGDQGVGLPPPLPLPHAIVEDGGAQVSVRLPAGGGLYRLTFVARDGWGGGAAGNLPIRVRGRPARFVPPVATLPLVVFPAAEGRDAYSPSGWMGEAAAIGMDLHSADEARPGRTCLRVDFRSTSGWGGVAWQSPANDWGTAAGGFDLGEARQLTFLARGAKGGETVTFGFGLIGIEKRYHDSGQGKTEVTLEKAWKPYRIDLADRDLSCIKTAFYWTVRASGQPVTFYLDDIRYQ